MPADRSTFRARRERAAAACREAGIAALLVSPGSDLAYLSGYRIHLSERLTCLVLPADGAPVLVVPALEAPRAAAATDCELRAWQETEDPAALVASLVATDGPVAVADQMWALFVLRLQRALRGRAFRHASEITRALRARKDAGEVAALRAVSASADRAYRRALALPFGGRAEREVGADLAALLREEGHDEVTFTIVAAGPNGASPHHETGERRLADGDAVVMDFGGTREWYCSDITRTVHVGGKPDAEIRRVHDAVRRAQEAGLAAARAGVPAEDVDKAARGVIAEAGYGERFIHRTGHGIGLDGHEHPYLVHGNREPLAPGMAFSIEPGIYVPGRFGVRLEDIVVLGDDGRAEALNAADHALALVS
ncbi:MAG TPA: aminopeptidase P family protein [Candidatus Limnocylindrales bacterium]|nr:aminopeptidase P family protein [Candidatus Limnocylindrales bacterium]